MRASPLLLCGLTLLLTVGCGKKSRTSDVTPNDSGNTEVAITIQNHHWSDARIYLLHDGISERLGLVTATTTHTFIILHRRLGPAGLFQLQADPVGGTSVFTSELISVQPGQAVTWSLESSLSRSSVMVY